MSVHWEEIVFSQTETRVTRKTPWTHLLNLGIALELQLILIGEVAELLLGNDDLGLGDVINLALLQQIIKLVDLITEPRRANLAALIEEIDREELSGRSGLAPVFHVAFGRDACADRPLVLVRRQAFDGVDGQFGLGACSTASARVGKRSIGSLVVLRLDVSRRALALVVARSASTRTSSGTSTSGGSSSGRSRSSAIRRRASSCLDVLRVSKAFRGGISVLFETEDDEDLARLHVVHRVVRDADQGVALDCAFVDEVLHLHRQHA